jgi:hypothetical protein
VGHLQVLLHLPDDIANSFKSSIPKKSRNAFVVDLLAKALPELDDEIFRLALDVENDTELADMASGRDAGAGLGLAWLGQC